MNTCAEWDKGRRGRQAAVADAEIEALVQRTGARVGQRRQRSRNAEGALLASTPSSSSEEVGGSQSLVVGNPCRSGRIVVQSPCSDQSEQPDDQQNGIGQLWGSVGKFAGASQTRQEVAEPTGGRWSHTPATMQVGLDMLSGGDVKDTSFKASAERAWNGTRCKGGTQGAPFGPSSPRDVKQATGSRPDIGHHHDHRRRPTCECDTRHRAKDMQCEAYPQATVLTLNPTEGSTQSEQEAAE